MRNDEVKTYISEPLGGELTVTNEELAALIQSGQTEAVLPLWQRVELFVRQRANKWGYAWRSRGISSEDLYQSGFLAMMKAVETYEPDKAKFLTWLGYHLRTAFSEAVGCRTEKQNNDPLNECRSLWEPVDNDTDGLTIGDTVADPVDYIGQADRRIYLEQLHDELERAFSALSEEESEVLRLRFYGGLSLKDAAKVGDITPDEARRREGKALYKLRQGKQAARLQAYIDERTPFYSAHGIHSMDWMVLKRERIEQGVQV